MTKEETLSKLEEYGIAVERPPEFLEHYGVKGMRWGVRRDRRTLDRIAGRTGGERPSKKQQDQNRAAARRARSKKSSVRTERRTASRNRRTLSTDDVRERINRLKLEKELKTLTNENLNPVRAQVTKMLTDAGWDVGRTVTKATMTVLARRALSGEELTAAEIAKYLKPKK